MLGSRTRGSPAALWNASLDTIRQGASLERLTMSASVLFRGECPLHVIGVASALGGPNPGTREGAEALRAAGLLAALRHAGCKAEWCGTFAPLQGEMVDSLALLAQRIAYQAERAVAAGARPLVLGGDHTCAIGTWRGVAQARGNIGLLWIDAHLDAHTPESSDSGRLHGMPLACLLGEGPAALTGPAPAVSPHHVAVVGVRSFEPEEAARLAGLGVRVFSMAEIDERGLAAVLKDARDIVARGTAGYGITLDLDALDPRDAPGVGVPVAGGLRSADLLAALTSLRDDPELLALEIAEYDPLYDDCGITARIAVDVACTLLAPGTARLRALEDGHGAHNYAPLPVVLSRGEGAWVWDTEGQRYLDMVSAYSAVSFGHSHPRLVAALTEQAARLAVPSRAFFNDKLPLLMARLTELSGFDRMLPVNTGLEAVETAIKAARKWAYRVKGVPRDRAEIIVCEGNFHGRSTTIVGMSSEPQYRDDFGPYSAGFKRIPFGDVQALEAAIGPDTAAFLVEPVQGEGGIIVPPRGYLARCAEVCRAHRVLLICDEVQTGLGRTGRLFAWQHDGVQPDGLVLGKALGGGLVPVSAFLAREEVMGVFRPGDHGSTFGGNPLGAAVALEALDLLLSEGLAERAAQMGDYLLTQLQGIRTPVIRAVRGRGLLVGVEVDIRQVRAVALAERMLALGVLTKDTHETVLRFTPPLVIERDQIDLAVAALREALADLDPGLRRAA